MTDVCHSRRLQAKFTKQHTVQKYRYPNPQEAALEASKSSVMSGTVLAGPCCLEVPFFGHAGREGRDRSHSYRRGWV